VERESPCDQKDSVEERSITYAGVSNVYHWCVVCVVWMQTLDVSATVGADGLCAACGTGMGVSQSRGVYKVARGLAPELDETTG